MLGYTGDDFIMTALQGGKPVTFHISESTKRNGMNLTLLISNFALNYKSLVDTGRFLHTRVLYKEPQGFVAKAFIVCDIT